MVSSSNCRRFTEPNLERFVHQVLLVSFGSIVCIVSPADPENKQRQVTKSIFLTFHFYAGWNWLNLSGHDFD